MTKTSAGSGDHEEHSHGYNIVGLHLKFNKFMRNASSAELSLLQFITIERGSETLLTWVSKVFVACSKKLPILPNLKQE
jgi:hypothetical protein